VHDIGLSAASLKSISQTTEGLSAHPDNSDILIYSDFSMSHSHSGLCLHYNLGLHVLKTRQGLIRFIGGGRIAVV